MLQTFPQYCEEGATPVTAVCCGSVSASLSSLEEHHIHVKASWGGPAAGRSSVRRPLACTTPGLLLWPVPRPGGRVQPLRTECGKGPPSKTRTTDFHETEAVFNEITSSVRYPSPCLLVCQRSLPSPHPDRPEWTSAVWICRSSGSCRWFSETPEPTRSSKRLEAAKTDGFETGSAKHSQLQKTES